MLEKVEKHFDPEEFIEEFEALTRDAGRVQNETLKKILQENERTEYLQKWGLNGKYDRKSFAELVPIVTHKDLEPYIRRIADGDTSPILTGNPIKTITLRYLIQVLLVFQSLSSVFADCEGYLYCKLIVFLFSSGTTQGKPKFVPFNDDLVESTMQIYKTSFAFRNR